jgi:hypothetical protein
MQGRDVAVPDILFMHAGNGCLFHGKGYFDEPGFIFHY